MATRFRLNFEQIFGTSAQVLAGGTLTFCISGGAPDQLQAIYQDDALTVTKLNPVTLDSAGKHGDIFLQAKDYRVIVKDAAGIVQPGGDVDPVHGGSSDVSWAGTLTDAITAFPAPVSLADGQAIIVSGRTVAGDGYEGTFIYKAADAVTVYPQSGLGFVDALGRRFSRVFGNIVYPEWFRDTADADDTAALTAAFASRYAIHARNFKTYRLSANITPPDGAVFEGNWCVVQTSAMVAFTITAGHTCVFRNYQIVVTASGTSAANLAKGIQLVGAEQAMFENVYVITQGDWSRGWSLEPSAANIGCLYINFFGCGFDGKYASGARNNCPVYCDTGTIGPGNDGNNDCKWVGGNYANFDTPINYSGGANRWDVETQGWANNTTAMEVKNPRSGGAVTGAGCQGLKLDGRFEGDGVGQVGVKVDSSCAKLSILDTNFAGIATPLIDGSTAGHRTILKNEPGFYGLALVWEPTITDGVNVAALSVKTGSYTIGADGQVTAPFTATGNPAGLTPASAVSLSGFPYGAANIGPNYNHGGYSVFWSGIDLTGFNDISFQIANSATSATIYRKGTGGVSAMTANKLSNPFTIEGVLTYRRAP